MNVQTVALHELSYETLSNLQLRVYHLCKLLFFSDGRPEDSEEQEPLKDSDNQKQTEMV